MTQAACIFSALHCVLCHNLFGERLPKFEVVLSTLNSNAFAQSRLLTSLTDMPLSIVSARAIASWTTISTYICQYDFEQISVHGSSSVCLVEWSFI